MTQRKRITMRFAVVALAVGMLSPTVSINDNGTAEVSMFNAAQAKKVHRSNNVKRNKNVRVNHNVKHHNGGHHNNHYNNHHDDHTAAKVLGGMAVGAAIVKVAEDDNN